MKKVFEMKVQENMTEYEMLLKFYYMRYVIPTSALGNLRIDEGRVINLRGGRTAL